jgi:hypothetical protein
MSAEYGPDVVAQRYDMHYPVVFGCALSSYLLILMHTQPPLIHVFITCCSFIKQYYELMAKNPSMLHRFYKAESFFTHCEGQQVKLEANCGWGDFC